eukprot:10214982-Prorocentrum_lima.AAC.1
MTSSLVGSEMCIRDRNKGGAALRNNPSLTLVFVRSMARNLPGGRCLKSVSYTHLTLPTICSV